MRYKSNKGEYIGKHKDKEQIDKENKFLSIILLNEEKRHFYQSEKLIYYGNGFSDISNCKDDKFPFL